MATGWGRLGSRVLIIGLAATLVLAGVAYCRDGNEREVKPSPSVLDSAKLNEPGGKIWALDFKFKDPRLIKVDIPGRGQKLCWYMWYQVTNNSSEPVTINPEFDLVHQDGKQAGVAKRDQILPKVQEEVRKLLDPSDFLKMKNSVSIGADPIPPTRPNAVPKPVTGVAIWDDVDPDSNRFDIYVGGLSNGYNISYPIGKENDPVVLRKTLRLRFRRVGDKFLPKSEDIRFMEPAEWIYRGSKVTVPAAATKEKPKDKGQDK